MPAFKIVNHGCAGLDRKTCSKTNCSLVGDKCLEPALTVQDGSKTYVIDTGSQETILGKNHDMCRQANQSNEHYEYVQRFVASSVGVFDAGTTTILGVDFRPMCSIGTVQEDHVGVLTALDHDGLVGVIDVRDGEERGTPGIIMNKVRPKTMTIDKAAGTFCLGGGCSGSKRYPVHEMKQPEDASLRYPLVDINGKGHILDTGSTISNKMSERMCLVGYNDIDYMHVDYDSNQLSFKLSTENPCDL